MKSFNLNEDLVPNIKKTFRGISITLLREKQSGDKCSQDRMPLRNWLISETIFNNRMMMAFNETGSLRSPIDITGMVLKRYPTSCWNERVKIDINRDSRYTLQIDNLEQHENFQNGALFTHPQLCYIAVDYVGAPFLSSATFLDLFDGLNVSGKPDDNANEEADKCNGTLILSVAPSGRLYVYSDFGRNSLTNENYYSRIELPSLNEIEEKNLEKAKKIRDNLSNTMFNYDLVFCVNPTLLACFRVFADAYHDLKQENDTNQEQSINTPSQNMFGALLLAISFQKESENNDSNSKGFFKMSNLPGLFYAISTFVVGNDDEDKKKDYDDKVKEIAKYIANTTILIHQKELELKNVNFFKYLALPNSEIKKPIIFNFLKEYSWNIPIHFKIDPLAKISSQSS